MTTCNVEYRKNTFKYSFSSLFNCPDVLRLHVIFLCVKIYIIIASVMDQSDCRAVYVYDSEQRTNQKLPQLRVH